MYLWLRASSLGLRAMPFLLEARGPQLVASDAVTTNNNQKKSEALRGFAIFNECVSLTVDVAFQVADGFFLGNDRFLYYVTHRNNA